MQAVRYIPEVIRAWDTATRGLLGAFLISIFIAIPTAIWFIDLSHRRGRSILQERHERGPMLGDRALLRAELLQHNQARYDADVHAHCPGPSPPPVLAMRSEEHNTELQALMRTLMSLICLKKN